jgi:pyruvate dehydrogenase E1 component
MEAARGNRLHPDAEPKVSYVEQCLAPTAGPIVAASDYVSAVADLIRPWVPRRYAALGTDGYGRSDTRAALRRFFEVDRSHIAVAALSALVEERKVEPSVVAGARARYGIEASSVNPWER